MSPRTDASERHRLDAISPGGRRLLPVKARGISEVPTPVPCPSAASTRPGSPRARTPRRSSDGRIVRPRALAVSRLMTSSNLVGGWIGRLAGLAPLRI